MAWGPDGAVREPAEPARGIADITITSELWARPASPVELAAEAAAIRRLADTMATDPKQIFQLCAWTWRSSYVALTPAASAFASAPMTARMSFAGSRSPDG